MKVQSTPEKGTKRTFLNLGAAWQNDSGMINVIVDAEKNRKQNKATGMGYKLFVVPVDGAGDCDFDEALEISKFTVKPSDNQSNERAPTHSVFTWE
jgi:hypothetical protein